MTPSIGTRLGPYEITARLGAGGMGEVYRATDTNLKRQVAIKVLPPSLATDPQRLARFQREAEILAALNHPNIAHIHGLERFDGTVALLMELVEGPTLAERIASGAVPIDDVLPMAKQIAEALEAAHEQHIVHRDLKPANIKVREDGTVKVLDFGLAKAVAGEDAAGKTGGSALSISPTITSPAMTQAGMILGTAAYMAPEQAKGRLVDKRADVWAFGCVVYEMLTARRPFAGEDITDTLANVLKTDVEWQALPPTTPPALVRLLKRCLEKDPRRRLRDIGEARVVIEDQLSGKSVELTPGTPPAEKAAAGWRSGRSAWPLAIGLSVAIATVTGFAVWRMKPGPAPAPVKRFVVALRDGDAFTATGRKFIALSPDATHLVYNANRQLYIRAMDKFAAVPIDGTANATNPFFSPDGQWVGFWQDGHLKKVATSGGAPVVLCNAVNPFGVSWEADGTILFGQGPAGIMRVADGGGSPSVAIAVEKGEVAYGPQLLPDQKSILFAVATSTSGAPVPINGWDDAQIVIQSIDAKDRQVIVRGGAEPRYLPTGHLVYLRQGVLLAMPFDARRRASTGNPVAVVDSVRSAVGTGGVSAGGVASATGAGQFAVSPSGLLAYVEAPPVESQARALVWVDRQGHETPVPGLPPRAYAYAKISPDGKRFALDIRDEEQDIWVFDVARETLTKLTFDKAPEIAPRWTTDGQRIAYFRSGGGLFWQRSDGSGLPDSLAKSGTNLQVASTFTTDGKSLLFEEQNPSSTDYKIKMLDLESRRVTDVLTDTDVSEYNAAISPDGHWMAYQSQQSGGSPNSFEVFVRPFPNVNAGKWQISIHGGTRPVWSGNGRELFYFAEPVGRETNASIMSVPIEVTPTFRPGNPVRLFSGSYYSSLNGLIYDVSPDGQRFLMIKPPAQSAAFPPRILVVDNWLNELNARVPVK